MTRTDYDGQEAIPGVFVYSCPQGSIPRPQSRRAGQSFSQHRDGAQGHSGDWITAYPISLFRLRLDDETLQIHAAFRVGLDIYLAHQCRCWATVESDGLHPLSCRFSACRFLRHAVINGVIMRSLYTTGLHKILEMVGLDRGDGRRSDGVTSFFFKGGKALAWDATCTDSFSPSNPYATILIPGSA